jgi:multiple antibiotic resistance protein
LVKFSDFGKGIVLGFCLAIVATMTVTYVILVNGKKILSRIGPLAIDAITRLVGFFVSAMGMGLIFHGVGDAIREFLKGA